MKAIHNKGLIEMYLVARPPVIPMQGTLSALGQPVGSSAQRLAGLAREGIAPRVSFPELSLGHSPICEVGNKESRALGLRKGYSEKK
jgi:hypothetical protein